MILPSDLTICPDSVPNFLGYFDLTIAPSLLYYVYIPIIFASLFSSFFVFFKSKRSLESKILLAISIIFSLSILDEINLWVATPASFVYFGWQLVPLFQLLIWVLSAYFIFVFITKKDISFRYKTLLTLPVIIFLGFLTSVYNVAYFDINNCEAVVGPLLKYVYLFEGFIILLISAFCIHKYLIEKKNDTRQQILYALGGVVIFLGLIEFSNVSGDLTKIYSVTLLGPIGMLFFIFFFGYIIVKFKTFQIKLISAQVLIAVLALLIFSLFFLHDFNYIRIFVAITLAIVLIVGRSLIKSIKKEVEQKEALEIANEGQSNLIHIINHQIKGYLAKGRNIFSELNSGDYGVVTPESKNMLDTGFKTLSEAVDFVQSVLNSSSVESGTMKYNMVKFNISSVLNDLIPKQEENAKAKNLAFEAHIEEGIEMNGDMLQLKEAFRNMIDNSIHYTLNGFVHVELKKVALQGNKQKLVFSVTDSGVGISDEDKLKLFTKGGRGKDSLTLNVNSTGYGLSFVKGVIEAHKGTVRAESEGKGKGSKFVAEIPLV